MAITLAQSKVGMADKVDQMVIDQFRRNSYILDRITFDNAVSPGTGGSTLTYGYIQLKTPSKAGGRAINAEYTASVAEREKKTTDIQIMGGAFEIDRVIASTSGAVDEVAFQLEQLSKATINRFQNLFINGKKSVSTEFDGIDTLVEGTDTDFTTTADLTGDMTDAKADAICQELDGAIARMMRKPDAIIANWKTLVKLKSAARKLQYNTRSEDAFGRPVDGYNGIPFVDLEQVYDGTTSKDIVPVDATKGTTNIYLVAFGMDAVHGVSPKGEKVINTILPNFTLAGAVKKGEVELLTTIAAKNSRAIARIKGVKVAAAASGQ